MNALSDIFQEYIGMRSNGLDTNDVLKALSQHISPLPKTSKMELGSYIRSWEQKNGTPIRIGQDEKAEVASKPSGIKSLRTNANSGTQSGAQPTKAQTPAIAKEAVWITCANCNAKNRLDNVLCYQCGHILEDVQGQFGTRQFKEGKTEDYDPAYFGKDSVLVLKSRDTDNDYELRPQLSDHELVIGRSAENSAMMPDLDLTECGADRLGVSRLHFALVYDSKKEAINIYDLGSANGTFVNGQKLHPKEMRLLRNGDEVRIGRLVTRTFFFHPGEEI